MRAANVFLLFLLILLLFLQATHQIGFQRRYFTFEQVGACPIVAPNNIAKVEKFVLNQPKRDHYFVDGELTFFRNITATVRLHIRSIRCSLEGDSKCFHNDGMQFGVCEHLGDNNALWTPFIESIQPRLLCPIKMGSYKIANGTLDFSIMAQMPLDGFRYSINFKFYEMTKPKRQEILCLEFNVAISMVSGNPSRKRGKPKFRSSPQLH